MSSRESALHDTVLDTRSSALRRALLASVSARWAFHEPPSLRRGPVNSISLRPTSDDLPVRGSTCAAAGALGFALGKVGEIAWSDPLGKLIGDMPVSRIQSPIATRRLTDIGAIAGKALLCPR